MRKKQQGMTAIGMTIVLSMAALISYGGFMVLPFYLETTKVDALMADIKNNFDGKPMNVSSIRTAIGKRLNIETINSVSPKDFKIQPSDRNFQVSIAYDREVRYIGNLFLMIKYDKTIEIAQ
jgi:hypothetical protein